MLHPVVKPRPKADRALWPRPSRSLIAMAQGLACEPKHPYRRTRHRHTPLPGITFRLLLVGASRSLLRRGRRIWQRKTRVAERPKTESGGRAEGFLCKIP